MNQTTRKIYKVNNINLIKIYKVKYGRTKKRNGYIYNVLITIVGHFNTYHSILLEHAYRNIIKDINLTIKTN